MGLDITAYSHLKAVGKHYDGDWCENENHVSAFAYAEFPQSFRGIPVLSTMQSGGSAFLEGGCYETTDATEEHDFRAGSYGGYNQWRADLQEWFNPLRVTDGPFYELIWFADNEGSIGPEAAVDLLADFREHAAAYAAAHVEDPVTGRYPAGEGNWYRAKYQDWTRAFELAADGGLVRFH